MKEIKTTQALGQLMRQARKSQGLSQEQLSERVEITPNYLSRIERGTENPTLDMLIRLADALEVEMWEIFDFGHKVNRTDLKMTLNKLVRDADEETLRLAVKILRAVIR